MGWGQPFVPGACFLRALLFGTSSRPDSTPDGVSDGADLTADGVYCVPHDAGGCKLWIGKGRRGRDKVRAGTAATAHSFHFSLIQFFHDFLW